jgi:hypothetical protein
MSGARRQLVENQAVDREVQQANLLGAVWQARVRVEGNIGVEALPDRARQDLVQARSTGRLEDGRVNNSCSG